MKILHNATQVDINKRTVFLDIDDVILASSPTAVKLLNKRFNVEREVGDMTTWSYMNMYPGLTQDIVKEVFSSDEFWADVELDKAFMSAFENGRLWDRYNWVFVSKGDEENLKKKVAYFEANPFFRAQAAKWSFYGLGHDEFKKDVHMMGGIQIDDNYDNLKYTDADVKILVKNLIDADFNARPIRSNFDYNNDNLYVTSDTKETVDILNFIADSIEDGYDFIDELNDIRMVVSE